MFTEDKTEYFDEEDELLKKVKKMAKMIRKAKKIVVYTGAGISTSAGIPDYRGPNGVWTCRNEGRKAPRVKKAWNLLEPTFAHMSIATLIERGIVKHLVSQNVDGLHVHSGVPLGKISELHGNTNKEYCQDCKKEYFRPFCVAESSTMNHLTGRICDECGGSLMDSIINFGEILNPEIISRALNEAQNSDLSLIFGTSLRVAPANKLPTIPVENGNGKMAICNLQRTPLDSYSKLLVRGKTDKVFKLLMKELQIPVLSFKETLELRAKERKVKKLNNKNENENKKENEKEKVKKTKKVKKKLIKKKIPKNQTLNIYGNNKLEKPKKVKSKQKPIKIGFYGRVFGQNVDDDDSD
ncbi:nad-dependent protein deacetylase sirtuin-7 [Anaeramoeba flamelloides]|uniref:protein acetyllysine N-acetyltransferase n=1 Tax=Anaeramoeba flamelloides TaxID=1746091 RepID=A0AAV7YIK1_9EUKA|nr:nad-dependent protein deacetylase sirtuin-7 [Anaeramoeba flamelloides]